MKRLIALIFVCALLVGCTPQVDNDGAEPTTSTTETQQTVEYIFVQSKTGDQASGRNSPVLQHVARLRMLVLLRLNSSFSQKSFRIIVHLPR